jgi:TrmH family RNA methyltransferase
MPLRWVHRTINRLGFLRFRDEDGPMDRTHLVAAFSAARSDPDLVVLEGFHAIKHALRFKAQIDVMATVDAASASDLASQLAPDIATDIERAAVVPPDAFAELAADPPPTGLIAIARRPSQDADTVLRSEDRAPVVFLDRPRHLGNLGAVIRVAAAASAAGVLTSGDRDPWHPAAVRGSAGLHFALPVVQVDALAEGSRPLVALDTQGADLGSVHLPERAVLAFGSERSGLEAGLLRRVDLCVRIPMRPGVSSLNLATAVAVVLFAGPTPDQR